MEIVTKLKQNVFNSLHQNKLIYNTCWEDPRCDRALLGLDADSRVVMISSAGCNALDYLLDVPAEIHAVDLNYRQNALLMLKKAVFERCDAQMLYLLFGEGAYVFFDRLLPKLRDALPNYAYRFWEKHSHYFEPRGLRKSFYYHGTSGLLAYFIRQYLYLKPSTMSTFRRLFEVGSLSEQQAIAREILPDVWNKFFQWISGREASLYLAGVPKAQRDLMKHNYPGGVRGYISDCLNKIFVDLPLADNYFYYLYIHGHYHPNISPNYLKPTHFDFYHQHHPKIQTYNQSISAFLEENPGRYTHFVLLDHQDWLANHNLPALEEEWQRILQNSQSGTRILMRSAARELYFLPDFVREAVEFDTENCQTQHRLDRVGTYASVHLAIVK